VVIRAALAYCWSGGYAKNTLLTFGFLQVFDQERCVLLVPESRGSTWDMIRSAGEQTWKDGLATAPIRTAEAASNGGIDLQPVCQLRMIHGCYWRRTQETFTDDCIRMCTGEFGSDVSFMNAVQHVFERYTIDPVQCGLASAGIKQQILLTSLSAAA
jgi:hypothetical protein